MQQGSREKEYKRVKIKRTDKGHGKGVDVKSEREKIVAIASAAILFENSTYHVLHRWVRFNQKNSCDVI